MHVQQLSKRLVDSEQYLQVINGARSLMKRFTYISCSKKDANYNHLNAGNQTQDIVLCTRQHSSTWWSGWKLVRKDWDRAKSSVWNHKWRHEATRLRCLFLFCVAWVFCIEHYFLVLWVTLKTSMDSWQCCQTYPSSTITLQMSHFLWGWLGQYCACSISSALWSGPITD